MKTRQHHIDIIESQEIQPLSFHERNRIQLEMIQDHGYLCGQSLEDAAMDWVQSGLATTFANHYPMNTKT
jgi:hypothetical protein